jgi:hypothetical protein
MDFETMTCPVLRPTDRGLPFLRRVNLILCLVIFSLAGCGSSETAPYPLDQELARSSVEKAMQAWVDGKTPKDLKPEIIMGDSGWEQGRKLVSFEIIHEEETSDGSNLHIRVLRKFDSGETKVTYIVGTSPVVTIFPQ